MRPRWFPAYLTFLFILTVVAFALAALGGEPMRTDWPYVGVLAFFTVPLLVPLVVLGYSRRSRERPTPASVLPRWRGFFFGIMLPLIAYIAADLGRRTFDYETVGPLLGLLWIVYAPALPMLAVFPVHDARSAKVFATVMLVVACSAWGGLGHLIGRWCEGRDEPGAGD